MDTHHCSHRCLNSTSCQVSWSIRFLEEQGFYCTWIIWKPSAPLLPWVHGKITWCTLHISSISRVIIYSLGIHLFLLGTSLLFHAPGPRMEGKKLVVRQTGYSALCVCLFSQTLWFCQKSPADDLKKHVSPAHLVNWCLLCHCQGLHQQPQQLLGT